jgi:hypothetical protein
MPAQPPVAGDVYRLLGYIEDDLRSIHRKMTEVRMLLATMNLPKRVTVHACGPCHLAFYSDRELLEHRANIHDDEFALRRLRQDDDKLLADETTA